MIWIAVSSIDDKLPLKVNVSHKTKTVMNVDEQNDDESTKVNSFKIMESATDVKEFPPPLAVIITLVLYI